MENKKSYVLSLLYKLLSTLGAGKITSIPVISNFISSRIFSLGFVDKFITARLKSTFEVDGNKMLLTRPFLFLSFGGMYEPLETGLVRNEIRKGDVVLDLGAHIGYYTLIFAKLVGERGKVFAFEPNPDNCALLKKNIEMNGYLNVIVEQKAVTNKTGKIRFYLSRYNAGDHRIYDSHEGRDFIEIDAISLDDYFKDYDGKLDFVKMDIQGAEAAAVKGMLELLKKNTNIKIMAEFWPKGIIKSGMSPKDYLELLGSLGFEVYDMNDQKNRIEPIEASKLLERYNPSKENFTNILLTRRNGLVSESLLSRE